QALAHRRAAHSYAVDHERRYLFDAEPPRPAGLPEGIDRAAGIAAVAKIIAHHHVPRTEPRDDQLIDERLRTHRPDVLIEAQRHQAIDPERLEGGELLAPTGEARRCTIRIDEFLGT